MRVATTGLAVATASVAGAYWLTLDPYFFNTSARESYDVAVTLLPVPRAVIRPREKLKLPSPTTSVAWDAEYLT